MNAAAQRSERHIGNKPISSILVINQCESTYIGEVIKNKQLLASYIVTGVTGSGSQAAEPVWDEHGAVTSA